MKNFFIVLISVLIGVGIGIGIMSAANWSREDYKITGKLIHKSPRANNELYLVIELSENQTVEYETKKKIGRPLMRGTSYTFTYHKSLWASEEIITKAIVAETPPER